MNLNFLKKIIAEHKKQTGGMWPFKRKFSQQLINLENSVNNFLGNKHGDLTLEESYQLSSILLLNDFKNEIDFKFIEGLRIPILGDAFAFTIPAQAILKQHNRLKNRYWSAINNFPNIDVQAYARLFCQIPVNSLSGYLLAIFKNLNTPADEASAVIDLLIQNNFLTPESLSILTKPYLDHMKVAETLINCRNCDVVDEKLNKLAIELGDMRRYPIEPKLQVEASLNELTSCITQLKKANAINSQTLEMLMEDSKKIYTLTPGIIKLQSAKLLSYAKVLERRCYPEQIADVLILLNHFNRLTPEVVNNYIINHRQPENMRKPLQRLVDEKIDKPEYIDFILQQLNAESIIEYAIKFEKANINFKLEELNFFTKRIDLLDKANLLNQVNYNKIKVLKMPLSLSLALNGLADEKKLTQDILNDVFEGKKTSEDLLKLLEPNKNEKAPEFNLPSPPTISDTDIQSCRP